jgi:hypothetical protein
MGVLRFWDAARAGDHSTAQGKSLLFSAVNRKSVRSPISQIIMISDDHLPGADQSLAVLDHVVDSTGCAGQLRHNPASPGPAEHEATSPSLAARPRDDHSATRTGREKLVVFYRIPAFPELLP